MIAPGEAGGAAFVGSFYGCVPQGRSNLRKKPLDAAIVAAMAIGLTIPLAANAVFLNPNGLGEALVFPYYTVNAGNSTVVTLVNATSHGKAVKVRVLEAYNGRNVYDVNVYLPPLDVWVAQIVPTAQGAGIFSTDNSCTVPVIARTSAAPSLFYTQAFDGSGAEGADGGPTSLSRTREGYIEVIEMGEVTNASKYTLSAITHSAGVPSNCAQVTGAWASGGYWQFDSNVDIAAPAGGLMGAATIVDVARGTVEAYLPDAIAQFFAAGSPAIHTGPGALAPTLASATSTSALIYAHALSASGPDLPVTATYRRGIDAVSAVFMADEINNEYWTSGGVAGNSEWVVTFPTKRFYTDPYYVGATPMYPFLTTSVNGRACVGNYIYSLDREDQPDLTQTGFMPSPPPSMCLTTQIITFNQPSGAPTAILGSTVEGVAVTTKHGNGWAKMNLGPGAIFGADDKIVYGLPVTGFWVTQFVNGNINGVLANFSAAYRHRGRVTCRKNGPDAAPCA